MIRSPSMNTTRSTRSGRTRPRSASTTPQACHRAPTGRPACRWRWATPNEFRSGSARLNRRRSQPSTIAIVVDTQGLGELWPIPFVRDRVFVLVWAPVRPLSVDANQLVGSRGSACGDHRRRHRQRPSHHHVVGLSWLVLDVEGGTVSEARRRATAQLSELSGAALSALDTLDPQREAWVINANNMCTHPAIGGRPVLGRSRAEWTALEDKTRCDELWAAAGVRHVPYEIVAADRDDLVAAARRLDRGAGTVWAGDARDGVNSGADLTRWVRDDDDIEPVAALVESHCKRARVMPFLEGVPCSIHGVLTVDGRPADARAR